MRGGGWRRTFPDVGQAVVLVGVLLGIQISGGMAIGCWLVLARGFGPGGGGLGPVPPVALLATNLVAFAVTLGWAVLANRGRNAELWRGGRAGWVEWGTALASVPGLLIVVVAAAAPLVALLRLLPGYDPANDPLAELMDFARHPIISVTTVVVLAPIGEEVLFRGYILQGLAERLRPRLALGLSTLFFVLVHMNLVQVPVSAALGLVCGWIFLRTRSLALCIAVHLANNALALFAERLPFAVAGFNAPAGGGAPHPWWFELAGAGAAAAALAGFAWASRGRLVPPPLPEGAGGAEPPLLPPELPR